MATEDRSRGARDRAQRALAELAVAFGPHARDLIVIGGLNPDFLAPAAPVPHLGTTDVDILLELGVVYDRDDLDYSWLPSALSSAGFEPRTPDGWQWIRVDAGDTVVRIDLLCDVEDSPSQSIALPGAPEASAKNLPGPSAALAAPVTRELVIEDAGARQVVELRFAGLGGYLLAKASALVVRGLPKDAYDLMFVMLYCPGGPASAAAAIIDALPCSPPHRDHHADLRAALRRFADGDAALRFAEQMRIAGDEATLDELTRDALLATRLVDGLLSSPDGASTATSLGGTAP